MSGSFNNDQPPRMHRVSTMHATCWDANDIPTTFRSAEGRELTLQCGPRKEEGVNGLTADEVLEGLLDYSKALCRRWPTAENLAQVASIQAALEVVRIRTRRREAAQIEGTSAAEI